MATMLQLDVSRDGIATVRMCNGENRFRMSFIQEWNKTLDEIERNDSVKGLIITGTGKFFSLGLDRDYFQTQPPEYTENLRKVLLPSIYRRLLHFPVPTVAAINGHAYGAGAFLALTCDFRVMRSDRGWLCWPEVNLGMQFQPPSVVMIRAKIPSGRAQRDAVLFGKRLTAQESYNLQIVDVVTDISSIGHESKKLIKEVLGKNGIDRKSLQAMKIDVYGNTKPSDRAGSRL